MRVPRVSIGMPVWNSDRAHFGVALESLLAQSFGDFEIVLSDNASESPAREMYAEAARLDPRIRLVRHDVNTGAIGNFGYVLKQARGEFFMWAADDDARSHDLLRRCVEELDRNSDCVTAGALASIIDSKGREVGSAEMDCAHVGAQSPSTRLRAMHARHVNMDVYALHRRSVLEHIDLTIPSVWIDLHITIELLLHGRIARIEEPLFHYRVSESRDESYERRAYQHFGATEPPAAFKDKGFDYSAGAFRLLATVLLSDAALSPTERTEAFLTLATILGTQGWFTRNQLRAAIPALKTAVKAGDITGAIAAGARLVTASPTFPLRIAAAKLSRLLGIESA